MLRISLKARYLILTLFLPGSLFAEQSITFSNGYDPCAIVDAFQKLHDDANQFFPRHFGFTGEAQRDGTEFDVNQYFEVLKHISPPNGFVLDYVYFGTMDGRPVLYWRKKSVDRFLTYSEYKSKAGGYKKVDELENGLSSRLVLDGTPESFLEFLIFNMFKGQFYLRWHMKYRTRKVFASKRAIGKLISEIGISSYSSVDEMMKDYALVLHKLYEKDVIGVSQVDEWREKYVSGPHGWLFCEDQIQEALTIDATPKITAADKKTITVSIIVFTPWLGFLRLIKTIEKQQPYKSISTKGEKLVPYFCGITSY